MEREAGMFFGKVVGTVVATRKDIHLEGKKLLVVARTDHSAILAAPPSMVTST